MLKDDYKILVCNKFEQETCIPSIPGTCSECGCAIRYDAKNHTRIAAGEFKTICVDCVPPEKLDDMIANLYTDKYSALIGGQQFTCDKAHEPMNQAIATARTKTKEDA